MVLSTQTRLRSRDCFRFSALFLSIGDIGWLSRLSLLGLLLRAHLHRDLSYDNFRYVMVVAQVVLLCVSKYLALSSAFCF
jgi:hypothetical protein